MATKTEKRRAERTKEQRKAAAEHMKNLTPNEVVQLENYCVYQILYINDAACNECKFLDGQLEKIPYKSKAVQKTYNALIKRVDAYWEMVNSTTIDKNSLAELFSNIDQYLDGPILKLRQSIEDVLKENGVDRYEWVAAVETAYTMCNFAEQYSLALIKKISQYSTHVRKLRCIVITAIKEVAYSLTKMVQEIHMGAHKDVDLSVDKRTVGAYKRLQKAVMDPSSFMNAINMADKINSEEGNMKLMYED